MELFQIKTKKDNKSRKAKAESSKQGQALSFCLKRDKVKYADEMGKRLINFQLTWYLLIGLWYSAIILTMLFHNDVRIPNFGIRTLNRARGLDLLIIAFPILLYIYNLILIVVNSIRSYQYQEVVYQPAIRFIK